MIPGKVSSKHNRTDIHLNSEIWHYAQNMNSFKQIKLQHCEEEVDQSLIHNQH